MEVRFRSTFGRPRARLGNVLGCVSGFRSTRWWSRGVERNVVVVADAEPLVVAFARGQHGVITSRQLERAGMERG